jgi:chemotaxis signal transduction protein
MTYPNAPATPRRLALVTIGSVSVGVDVACVVQALPLSATLAPLPRRRGALAGVVECGGVLVPVADLARWVETGAPAAESAARRILVLRADGRTIGLLADAVAGFADVPAAAVTRLHHDDDPDEVFQACVQVPETGTVVSILEVGRLVALACAWHDAPQAIAVAPAGPAQDGAATTLCAVLQVGTALLALPATSLAAVTARPALERTGMGRSAFCRWNDRHVAVAAEVGAQPGAHALLAILEHDGALLGIGVDAALDMRALVPPAPDAALATIYDDNGEAIDFVDVAALFARHPETALSVRPAAGAAATGARAANVQAQLVFDAGSTMATPLEAVEQVLPFDASGDVAGATMPWHGRAIALTDLRQVRGKGAILVLRHGSGHLACVVERVRSMVPPGGGQVYTMAQPGQGGPVQFITVASEGGTASYRIVDLAGQVDRLGTVPCAQALTRGIVR